MNTALATDRVYIRHPLQHLLHQQLRHRVRRLESVVSQQPAEVMVRVREDHKDLLSPATISSIFWRAGKSNLEQATEGQTWLRNHVQDGDHVRMIEAFQNLDLADRRRRYLRRSGVSRYSTKGPTPSRALCVMSFLSAIARLVAITTPFVTTLRNPRSALHRPILQWLTQMSPRPASTPHHTPRAWPSP